jgi:flagellar basal body-associated protein FliL
LLGVGVVYVTDNRPGDGRTSSVASSSDGPRRKSEHSLQLMFNPNERRRSRVCKMTLSFEVRARDFVHSEQVLAARLDAAKSELNIRLSDRRVDQILGTENLQAMRQELVKHLQSILFPDREAILEDVFVTDLIVQ